MSRQQSIEKKISESLSPRHLEVVNESSRHRTAPGAESHFKVVAVTDIFEGKSLLARHRVVLDLLSPELQGGVHALTLHLYTTSEWANLDKVKNSPPCHSQSSGG